MTTNTSLPANSNITDRIGKSLIRILGEDAYYGTDYQVTPAVQKLTDATNYLITQIRITAVKFETNEERNEHVNGVLEQLIEILDRNGK